MPITGSVKINVADECELTGCVTALLLSMERLKTVSSPWLMLNTFPECLSREQHGAEGSFNFLESEQKIVNPSS